MVVKHAACRDYPRSYAELRAWLDEDWKCLDYLDWLRWPEGFVCPHCASVVGWRLADSRWKCGGCDRKVSATAGTIFDKTRTPLTVWFARAWRMVRDKVGVSATQVQREMELGSYQTASVMLHRYRSVVVRPGQDRYEHTGTSVAASGLAAHEVLPAVHRVFSLVKCWLMGTMQGSVSPEHVQAYFDKWVFRFNRRHSRSRGLLLHTLLRQAVEGQPVTYRSLRKTGRTRPAPQPARGARQPPPSLDVGRPELPWRT